MTDRRRLLRIAAHVGVTAAAATLSGVSMAAIPRSLLILGGTGFIGPHLTRAALAHGWKVTHFNRGRTAKEGVPGVETLIGDRRDNLGALQGRSFDAVIDDSGYVPKQVLASAQLLAPHVGLYLFVSSISAYRDYARPNDEFTAALHELPDPEIETVSGETYGPMKALCERHVRSALGSRACIVRPGYIVGPLDPTDRFTYWPVRASQGGDMLAPGTRRDPVQFIDVRDLTEWMVTLIGERRGGVFNAVTPPNRFTMGTLIDACIAASKSAGTRATWVSGEILKRELGEEAVNLPPWAPVAGDTASLGLIPSARAQQAGLKCRALEVTVRDTLQWFESLPEERRSRQKLLLTREQEGDLLAAWHRAQSS